MNTIEKIEELLDMKDSQTVRDYAAWDKGECSEVGLCEILLAQLLRKHKTENGEYYNRDYDTIKLRYN